MKVKLPASWESINVGTLQELYPVLKSDGTLVSRMHAIISVLSGIPLEEILKIPLKDIVKMSATLDYLDKFTQLKEVKYQFVMNGEEYVADPEIRNMVGAQYIDFMEVMKDCDGEEGKIMLQLHAILSCFIRKKGEQYDGANAAELRETIRNEMPAYLGWPMAVFFWRKWHRLTKGIQDYGSLQVNSLIMEVERDLLKAGVGT